MKRNRWWTMLMAVALVAAGWSGAVAFGDKDKGPNTGGDKTKPDEKAEAVSDLAMAYQLARWGNAHEEPMALLTSAIIMHNTPTVEVKREKKTETDPKAGKASEKAAERARVTANWLLDQARKLIRGNKWLSDVIDRVASSFSTREKSRGRLGGPGIDYDRVPAYSTMTYTINFRGGEIARVYVEGDGDTDLDMVVSDENGNIVASDMDYTDRCLCEWYPRWSGTFYVRVRNRGNVYNEYALITN